VQRDVAEVLASLEVKKTVELRGFQPVANSSADFARVIRDETARWAQVIKDGNIKAD